MLRLSTIGEDVPNINGNKTLENIRSSSSNENDVKRLLDLAIRRREA
jgi:hypothetical protein